MVYTETYKILDGGTKKSVPIPYMTKQGLKLFYEYQKEESEMKYVRSQLNRIRDEVDEFNEKMEEWHRKYNMLARELKGMEPPYDKPSPLDVRLGLKPYAPKLDKYNIEKKTYEKYENFTFIGEKYHKGMDSFLFKYYDIKPFEPWVMLNISPNWAGKKISRSAVYKLKTTFESYLKEEWYSEWYYVLEAGGNGDHLHLHALCKMNKDKQIKSVRSHVSKHWKRQIQKHARDTDGGFGGLIKLPGMQSIVIQGDQGEQILNDKMDYLVEEKKPIGHKNKTPKTLEKVLGVLNRGSL